MSREITSTPHTAAPLEISTGDLANWLDASAREHGLVWLLVHSDEGIYWGEFRDTGFAIGPLSSTQTPATLNADRIQQARAFGENAEVRIWRSNGQLRAALLRDTSGEACAVIDEEYLLWGTDETQNANGFRILAEGNRGIIHAPPLREAVKQNQRAALSVRHYLRQDPDSGMFYIADSRLVSLNEAQGGQA